MSRLLSFMTVIYALASIWAPPAGVAEASERATPKTINVLPIGDSITQGGRADRPEYTYRYPLYFMLRDAGFRVDFIGSMRTGLQPEAVWPDKRGVPFDLDHEAHYGWTSAQVRDRLRDVLASYPAPADIALIQLGSNDIHAPSYEKASIEPIKDIVGMLRERNPRVIVLIGHLLEHDRLSRATRPLVERMANEITTPMSPVVTVRLYENWWERPSWPWTDTFDWAHPNPKGQQKMADKWFAAMLPYLEPPKGN